MDEEWMDGKSTHGVQTGWTYAWLRIMPFAAKAFIFGLITLGFRKPTSFQPGYNIHVFMRERERERERERA